MSEDPPISASTAAAERWVVAAVFLHQVSEALTALGNYLAAAHRKSESQAEAKPDGVGELLRRSLDQHERACAAIRLLADSVRDDEVTGAYRASAEAQSGPIEKVCRNARAPRNIDMDHSSPSLTEEGFPALWVK